MEFCLGSSKSLNKNKLIENDYEIDEFELDYFPSYPLEKQVAIETSKMVGNELFNCGNFKKAILEYTKGIGNFNTSKQQEQAADDNSGPLMLLSTLLSNRALAYIKLGEYEQALYDSRAVIAYRSDWEKGFFLRGEAYFGLRLFEKAVSSFAMALKLSRNNPIIKSRLFRAQISSTDEMSGFEIHQLFPGREICRYSIFTPIQSIIFENIAKPLRNFIYLIADKESRDCIVIDACWDIDGILKYAKDKNLRIVGAVITHYHVDHIGGIPPPPYDKYRVKVDGILKLKRLVNNLKVYAHELEIDNIIKGNPGLKAQDIIPTRTGTTFHIPSTKSELSLLQGGVRFEFYHTPGHTPGSQCLLVNGNRLFSGDTLFISSCGRVDFPDSCKNSMFDSLQNTLSTLNDDVS